MTLNGKERAGITSLSPDAGAHINLGNLLKEKRCFNEALKHFTVMPYAGWEWLLSAARCHCNALQAAVHIDPNFAAAYSNMGNVLKVAGC